MASVTNPFMASPARDARNGESGAANSAQQDESPLRLIARLGREAAITAAPRAFALQTAQAAGEALRVSHYGVTEILADGKRLSVHIYPLAKHLGASPQKFDVELAAEHSITTEALRTGQPLAVQNFGSGATPDDELQALGLQAALVVPLASQTHTYGALAVYHESPKSFDPEQLTLVESLAHLVTGALSRCRAEALALEKEQFEQALGQSMESMLVILSPDGKIQQTNHACQVVTGFAAGDLVGRSLWSTLMLPEEISVVKRALLRIEKDKATERFETYILTSDGLRRRIAWTASLLGGTSPAARTAMVTGIDITDRCEAVERAARAEVMAHDARRLCNELQDHIRQGEAKLDGGAQSRRLPAGVEFDRRARSRRSYSYVQRIAPMRGNAMPDAAQFNEWMCHDISSRGFSFLAPSQPDYHKIVVAFGAPPALVYLTADVRHATRQEENGRTQYIVGCRYTGRISKKDRGTRGERGA